MSMKHYFTAWKYQVITACPKNLRHMLPGDNTLVVWYEHGRTPEWVVDQVKHEAASIADSPC